MYFTTEKHFSWYLLNAFLTNESPTPQSCAIFRVGSQRRAVCFFLSWHFCCSKTTERGTKNSGLMYWPQHRHTLGWFRQQTVLQTGTFFLFLSDLITRSAVRFPLPLSPYRPALVSRIPMCQSEMSSVPDSSSILPSTILHCSL